MVRPFFDQRKVRISLGDGEPEYSGLLTCRADRRYRCSTTLAPPLSRCAPARPGRPALSIRGSTDRAPRSPTRFGRSSSRHHRRYIVKRIPRRIGEQHTLEEGAYHYFVCVTNDYTSSAAALESENRHKAEVEGSVRELNENFGLPAEKAPSRANGRGCCWCASVTPCAAGRKSSVDSRRAATD